MVEKKRANVSAVEFREYLRQFHRTYRETVELVPRQLRERLLRVRYLDVGLIGYVSTQYGAGFEYSREKPSGTIEYRLGSRPVEQLLFGTPPRLVKAATTGIALDNAAHATLQDVGFSNINPIRLAGQRTSVRLIDVHCEAPSLGWSRDIAYAELYGDRSRQFWSPLSAVERAKNEVLVALVDTNRAAAAGFVDIGQYLARFKARQVLVLGDYGTAGKVRLDSIVKRIRDIGYDPILLNEVPDEPSMDPQQKLVAIGAASRFIVIDDSSKSGHLVEIPHVLANRWITVILRLEGSEGTFMTKGVSATSSVVTERSYNTDDLQDVLKVGLEWAEQMRSNIVGTYESVFPWMSHRQ
jgi:hypothetical protein